MIKNTKISMHNPPFVVNGKQIFFLNEKENWITCSISPCLREWDIQRIPNTNIL